MKIAPLADVKARLSAYVESSQTEGPVVITRNGKPVAVLIAPTDEDDLEDLVLARSPRFLARIEQARRSIREGKGLSEAEFWEAVERGAAPRPRRK
jgi:prevent-host-death family protein